MTTARRSIAEIAKKTTNEGLKRGYLAEDFDGVGSTVQVLLSRGSSSAVQASVAAGAFGTEQTAPAGTPIFVMEYKGKLEVVSLGSKLGAGVITEAMTPAGGLVGGDVIADNSLPGSAIVAGSLTITDEFGTTVADASGFSGGWAGFIGSGFYNGNFAAAIPGALPDGRNDNLPYWDVQRTGMASLEIVADAAWPGGFYISGIPAALDDSYLLTSDVVEVTPGVPLSVGAVAGCDWVAGSPDLYVTINWLQDGEYLDSTIITLAVWNSADANLAQLTSGPVMPPDGANQAEVVFTWWETTAHSSSNVMNLGAVHIKTENVMGMQTQAWQLGASPWFAYGSTSALPANRAILIPLVITSPLAVSSLIFMNADTTLARAAEWRLYYDSDRTSILKEVPGAHGGTGTYIATAASLQSVPIAVGVVLLPGDYWLAVRNAAASNALTIAIQAAPSWTSTYGGQVCYAYKNAAGALGATFDMSTITGQLFAAWGIYLGGWSAGQAWG